MLRLLPWLTILLFTYSSNAQQFSWVSKTNFPATPRGACASFSIGNTGYVGGGFNGTNGVFSDFWAYDQTTDSWNQIASLPQALFAPVGFELNGFGYVGSGDNGAGYVSNFYKYNTTTNSWSSAATFPGGARYTGIVFTLNNKAYFGTGYSPYYNDLWEFNPANNSWSQLASLPSTPRQSAAAFTIGNNGYVYGGSTGSGILDDLWQYNPATNAWLQKANCPVARYGAVSFSYNNMGFIGTGCFSASSCYDEFYAYNATSDSWCLITSFPGTNVRHSASFKINNKVYFSTGVYNSNIGTNQLWELTITSATFNSNTTCDSAFFTSNLPAGAQSVMWYFGDGTTSNIINPSHQYNLTGTYTVSLVVNYGCGNDSVSQQITVGSSPNSVFATSIDTCNLAVAITNNTTNATSYSWDFDDGFTSVQSAPTHTYALPGIYSITLISTNACGIDTAVQTITINTVSPATSQFSFTIDSCTQSITLFNNSIASNNYYWDFGDSINSSLVNPAHTYADSGTYTTTLIAQNSCNTDTFSQSVFIPAPIIPVADFTSALDTCSATINLTNIGSGGIYSWQFGDGDTSNSFNTSHTYINSGNYSVSLYAINACGVDSEQMQITIPSLISPSTSFNYTLDTCSKEVSFINTTTNASGYLWNFDNGITSTLTNPTITYSDSGYYSIYLYSNNSCFSDSAGQIIYIPLVLPPDAQFSISLDTCNALVNTINNSTNSGNYYWNFGDGDTSTISNPQHIYTSDGTYTLQLTVSNSCGSDTLSQNIIIPYIDTNPASYYTSVDTCNKTLHLTVNPELTSWQWSINNQPFLSSDVILPATDSLFIISLIASNICFTDNIQDTLLVNLPDEPILNYSFTIDSCLNAVQLVNSSSNYNAVHWSFGDGSTSDLINPEHIYQNQGVFNITVQLIASCDTLEEIFPIEMNAIISADILPNTFTPNNDGMNDYYTVSYLLNCDEYTIAIFNRWGILLYESTDGNPGWDGKFNGNDCTEGVYYAVVKGSKKSYNTTVLLVR